MSEEDARELEVPDSPEEMHGIVAARFSSLSGPLPPPNILEGYKQVQADFPERILSMAERRMAHDQQIENRQLDLAEADLHGGMRRSSLGLASATVVSFAAIAGGAYATFLGHPTSGVPLMGGVIALLAGMSVYSTRQWLKRIETEEDFERAASDLEEQGQD